MEQATDMLSERVQEEKTLNWLLEQAVRLDAPKEAPPADDAEENASDAGGDDSAE